MGEASQSIADSTIVNRCKKWESLLATFIVWAQVMRAFKPDETFEKKAADLGKISPQNALKKLAANYNLKVKFNRRNLKQLGKMETPLIIKGVDECWFLLAKINEGKYLVQYPGKSAPEILSESDFMVAWSGHVAVVSSRSTLSGVIQKFDVRWFLPELGRFKGLAMEVLAASVVLQLFALVSPLFFQVIMDKVLVHHSLSTLDVLVTVLIAISVFEMILKTLRQYLASWTGTRIDARLGSKLYRHLIDLPLVYFKTCPVGVTVMRVSELNSIRKFITGAANTLIIDLGFTFIFFAVMYYYSPLLTLIVASSIPCFILLSLLITKPLQKQVEELYRDAAINNSFLTEILAGVETVKALALEPQMIRRWEYQTRDFVLSNYKVQRLMQLSNGVVQGIQEIVLALVLWIGARKVIGLELSIGQLIAFNMMASHVMQPMVRLAELWREFVQARVSLSRLSDVLNVVPEITDELEVPSKDIDGELVLQNVTFRYTPDGPAILEDLNLKISAGQMVAFVGRSGSGKSTITRLIQKLYVPEQGNIFLDGKDIASLNPVGIRQRIGVVLQENFLFNLSVRDNIAIADPAIPLSRVIKAAQAAGAHDFILELEDGYDTILAEGGLSLSGGQRQRIAIARALLSDPALLIFDEATSALDDVSQALIQDNMPKIRKGRSVIIVAHRLSTVRDCDCIFVIEKGQVIEKGAHTELLNNPKGAYRHLWDLQCAER